MKKFMVLFLALAFFTSFTLVGCGPSEQKPAPAKEEAKPAPTPPPAPEKGAPGAPGAPAPAPEKK